MDPTSRIGPPVARPTRWRSVAESGPSQPGQPPRPGVLPTAPGPTAAPATPGASRGACGPMTQPLPICAVPAFASSDVLALPLSSHSLRHHTRTHVFGGGPLQASKHPIRFCDFGETPFCTSHPSAGAFFEASMMERASPSIHAGQLQHRI